MRLVGIEDGDVDMGPGRYQGKEAVQGWILCARCFKERLREEVRA